MRSLRLSSEHYASEWPTEIMRKPSELTALGKAYAELPEGEAKEAKLLEIIQSFHGYMLKYLSMVLRGHLPIHHGAINKDTELLLANFLPKGKSVNRANLSIACRTLHLAFKGLNADEVYDTFVMCLVKATRRYDPFYTNKVKAAADIVQKELHDKKKFTATEVSRYMGDDCARYLRLLVKHLFLVSHPQTDGSEVRFSRSENWPPPPAFFKVGPVGLTYFVSKWFRYLLVDWITWRMGELETSEGLLQLEHRYPQQRARHIGDGESIRDSSIPDSTGAFTNPYSGKSISADVSMNKLPLDVGSINLDWVNNNTSGLFGSLSRSDRHLLYCVFAQEMNWQDVSETLQTSIREAKKRYTAIISQLSQRVKPPSPEEGLPDTWLP